MVPPPYPGQGIIITIAMTKVLIIVIKDQSDDHGGSDVYDTCDVLYFSPTKEKKT